MTEAEATIRHAIVNALTSTSDLIGLRAGPGCDRLVDAITASLLDPRVSRAVRDLTRAGADPNGAVHVLPLRHHSALGK
jgi:hypothetical protein